MSIPSKMQKRENQNRDQQNPQETERPGMGQDESQEAEPVGGEERSYQGPLEQAGQ